MSGVLVALRVLVEADNDAVAVASAIDSADNTASVKVVVAALVLVAALLELAALVLTALVVAALAVAVLVVTALVAALALAAVLPLQH